MFHRDVALAKRSKKEWYIKPNAPIDSRNILRPETVESLFIAYRITGDPLYREWVGSPSMPFFWMARRLTLSFWRASGMGDLPGVRQALSVTGRRVCEVGSFKMLSSYALFLRSSAAD